jgi:hypothetical protein
MSSVIFATAEHTFVQPDHEEPQQTAFLPLDPGSYVVLAKGEVVGTEENVILRLEVRGPDGRGATDQTSACAPRGDQGFSTATFALAVALNIAPAITPSDQEESEIAWAGGEPTPFQAGARLFARRVGRGEARIDNLRIIAFQVDSTISIVEAGWT